MPYLLLTPSALFWRRNDVLGHLLVQGADPCLMTEVSRALKSVMLYQRQFSNAQWSLPHHNGSKLLILSLHVQVHFVGLQPTSAPGKAFYIAVFSLISLIINRLISHVRLSPHYSREMLTPIAGELLRLSHGNQSHALLLNRFIFRGGDNGIGTCLVVKISCLLIKINNIFMIKLIPTE